MYEASDSVSIPQWIPHKEDTEVQYNNCLLVE